MRIEESTGQLKVRKGWGRMYGEGGTLGCQQLKTVSLTVAAYRSIKFYS